MALSVCILAYNAESKLRRCLNSVKHITDEIIVVIDDHTTDSTEQIAREYTDRVFIRPHEANFHILKQYAVEQASQKWILWLDDDEEVEPELAKEIKTTVEQDQTNIVYQVPRKNIIFDKWIQHTGWYPDYQLRLWRNSTVYWPCKSVHEHPQTNDQQLKSLTHHLVHYNYQTVSQWLSKLDAYSTNDANHFIKEFTKPYYKHFLIRPIDEFISRYMKDQGYKDGLHGLVLSLLQSFYMFIVVVKAWEMKNFPKVTIKDPLQKIEYQGKYFNKVWKWWKYECMINKTNSKTSKVFYKTRRKLG